MNWKTRARVIAVVLAVLLATITVMLLTTTQTPRHNGKTLSEWLVMLDLQVDRGVDRVRAEQAIRQMGAAALPQLRNILRRRPNSIGQRICDYAVRWHLLPSPKLNLADEQSRAAWAAYVLGKDGRTDITVLVPELTYLLTNRSSARREAARALAHAGQDGISCLTNFLAIGDPLVRRQAAWGLALDAKVRNRPAVQEALLRSAISDPDVSNRRNLVLYLSGFSMGRETDRFVPLALQLLKSEDGYRRWMGALSLQHFATIPEVKTALQAAASDSDERVRAVVAETFKSAAADNR